MKMIIKGGKIFDAVNREPYVADILVEDGKIAAFDTHENLLEKSEIYREIYETQTSGAGDFDETDSDKDIEVYDINRQQKKPDMPPFPMPTMSDKKSRKHKEVYKA